MLDALFSIAGLTGGAEADALRDIQAHEARVVASARRGDRTLVARGEIAVQRQRDAMTFDASGHATLRFEDRAYAAGRFEVATLGALAARSPGRGGRARLWLLDGAAASTDVASLQATAGPGTLVQVASQFNCLEAPGPRVVPVAQYLTDPTQGPRASVSAFPATLLRHHAAPAADGSRFTQTNDGPQVDLLARAVDASVARVRNGYLDATAVRDGAALLRSLADRFDDIAVGVHDGVEVALGYAWDGAVDAPAPRIAQVFTSTLAGGGYGAESLREFGPLCEVLLRAAYLGTLRAAAALDARVVVLTLIGGGVFGNPIATIWDSIAWALDRATFARDVEVVVNGRDLVRRLGESSVMEGVRARGGALLAFEGAGVAIRR